MDTSPASQSVSGTGNLSEAEEPLLQRHADDRADDGQGEGEGNSQSSAPPVAIPDLYCCPITRDLMVQPVLLVESGQVFEQEAIMNWIESGRDTCPVTGTQLTEMTLQTIYPLRSAIREWAEEHGVTLEGMEPWLQLRKQREEQEMNTRIHIRSMHTQQENVCGRYIRSCLGWFHISLFIIALMYLCTVVFYLAMEGLQVASENVSDMWGEWLMITAMVALTYTAFALITFCATAQCCDNLVNGPGRFLSSARTSYSEEHHTYP
eukprot:TRINITY_DN36222_c0_g1_i1.p3 TRINITY_DN36222_c0_g1~~TRINITY_DN36222_c0_g1_i1.p3  ORF type:complete len:264 (-),score=29.30 TRINITY_DN36222_c0_g1_i1:1000-1791(-)